LNHDGLCEAVPHLPEHKRARVERADWFLSLSVELSRLVYKAGGSFAGRTRGGPDSGRRNRCWS
jgi:hypothetical protein